MELIDAETFSPDPESAVDVLAFVLCPVTAFAPECDEDEIETVAEILLPLKAAAIKRWQIAHDRRIRC